uniref:peptide deformylase n=1 Tax=Streptomyces murinus TaxID=33900 RepID=UPI000A38257D
MNQVRPSEQMRDLGVVQNGAPVLAEPARAFDLPAEREAAEQVVEQMLSAMERIGQVHLFAKGMGIAAPQIGIGRAAAVVQPPGPQYEGCLSFFDVRGLVPRPLWITVETTTLEGLPVTTTYERGLARLIHHE